MQLRDPAFVSDSLLRHSAAARSCWLRKTPVVLAVRGSSSNSLSTFDTNTRRQHSRGKSKPSSKGGQQLINSKTGSQAAAVRPPVSKKQRLALGSNSNSSQHAVAAATGADAAEKQNTGTTKTAAPTTAAATEATSTAATPAPGQLPAERVWRRELRRFSGIMSDPNSPWLQPFILKHCYVVNTPDTRLKFIELSPADMHKLIKRRQQVEQQLAKSAHALSAAWKRLQLLSEAVVEKGQVLTEEQMNKEREQVVQMLDSLKEGQKLLARTVTTAIELSDQRHLHRSATHGQLLTTMAAVAESYLREYLRRIATASKINKKLQQMWQNTAQSLREPLYVVEGRRQQQLLELQAVAPDHPTQLLADYRSAALKFELYQDKQLLRRKASTGQPTSAGGIFWQESSLEGTLPVGTAAAAEGQTESTAAAAQQHTQSVTKLSWQQKPQQMMARPLQQLPLLPHLGRHQQWLPQLQRQQRARAHETALQFDLQQQQQQRQQQEVVMDDQQLSQETSHQQQLQQRFEQMRGARSWVGNVQRPALPTAAADGVNGPVSSSLHQLTAAAAAAAAADSSAPEGPALWPAESSPGSYNESGTTESAVSSSSSSTGRIFSYSGKVVPPMPVLLQRALQLEERLIREAEEKRAKFAANNEYVQAQRRGVW